MAAQVALRRQQTTTDSDANPSGVLNRIHKLETLLNQKRIYQKHLRSLQQSSLAKDVLSGKFVSAKVSHSVRLQLINHHKSRVCLWVEMDHQM